jgi:hypothetical protein
MFDWLNPDGEFVVSLPFKIYFGATFPLMIILILFMNFGKLKQRLKDALKEKKTTEAGDSSSTSADNGTTKSIGERDVTKALGTTNGMIVEMTTKSRSASMQMSLSMAEKSMLPFKEEITGNQSS